jgi:hypothetical protein
MKRISFVVHLTFADDISGSEEQLKEIANNIAESLKHTADTAGLAPEDGETFTESIEVSESGITLSSIKI